MNNSIILFAIIGIALLLLVYMLVSSSRNKEKVRTSNYRTFFVIGLIWLIIGIPTGNVGLWGMGIAFVIAGLVNKDKWKEETKWTDLSPNAKKIKILLIGGLTILLLVAIAFLKYSK